MRSDFAGGGHVKTVAQGCSVCHLEARVGSFEMIMGMVEGVAVVVVLVSWLKMTTWTDPCAHEDAYQP